MIEISPNLDIHKKKIPLKKGTGSDNEIKILSVFNKSIAEIEKKFDLLNSIENPQIYDNILRAQIVFLVSCVDYYIHNIINNGILSIIKKEKTTTKKLDKSFISISVLIKYLENTEDNLNFIEEEIINGNSYKSFVASEKMIEALSLISDQKIFETIAKKIELTKTELIAKIKEINDRRNSIAHQMDFNSTLDSEKNNIDVATVISFFSFYKKFINELHELLLDDNI